MTPKVLILGSSFAGLTAALAIQRELESAAQVTVISPSGQFVFNPSLIWLPFGKRTASDVTFSVAPVLERYGIEFVEAAATRIDTEHQRVEAGATYDYDYLVVATGYRNDFDVVPGLGPNGPAHTITTLRDAVATASAWTQLLNDPGPLVVVATQGASCFGAAYEFLFNASYHVRRARLRRQVPLTFVTSEPFLGHFGIGGLPHGEALLGMFLKKEGIRAIVDTSIAAVKDDGVVLASGETLPARLTMAIPPFLGQEVVARSGLGDARGYVPVRPTYQSRDFDNVYAIGIAAAVSAPWHTPTPVGVPKTGFPTEAMAHVAATNIAAQVRGREPSAEKAFGDMPAVCVMDAGNNGVVILADKMLPPRQHGVLIPGPQAHLMKLGFEKYFLWKMQNGYVGLP